MILDTPGKRRRLLDGAKSVAIIGASNNTLRPSYFIFRYLRTHGFEVWPVNPNHQKIDDVECYPSLMELARRKGMPDIVDVFRRSDAVLPVVEEAIALGAPAIWFQYGVLNAKAIARADNAGLDVVVDRCIKVEHARFAGGLSMTGMNSGVLSSRRRVEKKN